jgi:hypothetical protein
MIDDEELLDELCNSNEDGKVISWADSVQDELDDLYSGEDFILTAYNCDLISSYPNYCCSCYTYDTEVDFKLVRELEISNWILLIKNYNILRKGLLHISHNPCERTCIYTLDTCARKFVGGDPLGYINIMTTLAEQLRLIKEDH